MNKVSEVCFRILMIVLHKGWHNLVGMCLYSLSIAICSLAHYLSLVELILLNQTFCVVTVCTSEYVAVLEKRLIFCKTLLDFKHGSLLDSLADFLAVLKQIGSPMHWYNTTNFANAPHWVYLP